MRPIKYRAKSLENGEWISGVPIPNGFGNNVFMVALNFGDTVAYPMERLHELCVEVDPGTIGQYTERKDKRGVEIYDGDIFKAPHDFGPAGFHERVASVHFGKKLGYQWEYWELDELEIIGNIHENPELLEVPIEH